MRKAMERMFRPIMAATAASVAMAIAGIALIVLFESGNPVGALLTLVALVPLGIIFGVPIALAHILCLGLPAWLILRPRWTINRPGAAAIGFAIGATPATITASLDQMAVHGGMVGAVVVGTANLFWMLAAAILFGTAGALGALAFLATMRSEGEE